MSGTDTHTLATELRDFPEWHGGIRHYAVWALPVDCPLWLQRITDLQRQLAPLLHPGYARQPHITLFACGLVDQRHFHPQQARQQAQALLSLQLPALQLEATGLSTFTTAPWLGIAAVDNHLSQIRQTLAQFSPEDSPAPAYRPHITLGFYQQAWPLKSIHSRLAALETNLPPLPPLNVNRLELCFYSTHDIQGRLTVQDSIELKTGLTTDTTDNLDPLEAIKQLRQQQLKVCALKQKSELGRLITDAKTSADRPTPSNSSEN
jgi:2'-5' RNA ligase